MQGWLNHGSALKRDLEVMRKTFLSPWGQGSWEDVSLALGQLSTTGTDTLPEKGANRGRLNLEMAKQASLTESEHLEPAIPEVTPQFCSNKNQYAPFLPRPFRSGVAA